MGRIEDALKRAAAKKKEVPPEPPPPGSEQDSVDAPFVSPWHGPDPSSEIAHPARVRPGAKLLTGERARSSLRSVHPEHASPSLQLDSQLAMGWPQPFSHDVAGKLVVMRETDAAAVREFRQLAEALHKAQADRGVKSVMIASAVAGEGKTLTALNLSLTLSQSKGRVLLIDANVQHPHVHHVFQVSAGTGLTGCLKSTDHSTLPFVDVMSRLALLPAGTSGIEPSAIGSDAMRRVLTDVAQHFDWIVIDSPPIASVPESGRLASMVDAVILVVQADRTSQDEVRQAIETIDRARIMGVVLNRAGKKAMAEAARE